MRSEDQASGTGSSSVPLAVRELADLPGSWVVVHVPSGRHVISAACTRRGAQRALDRVRALPIDWSAWEERHDEHGYPRWPLASSARPLLAAENLRAMDCREPWALQVIAEAERLATELKPSR